MFTMIAAVGENREIGKDNGLLWKIPTDMKFFRETTKEHTIIMGRNTFESFGGRMLPKRKHIILTSKEKASFPEECEVYASIDEILSKYKDTDEEIFIIGGSQVYNSFYDYADKMYITHVKAKFPEADTFFPEIHNQDWNKKVLKYIDENGYKAEITEYKRKK